MRRLNTIVNRKLIPGYVAGDPSTCRAVSEIANKDYAKGASYLMILTSLSSLARPSMALGVIKMYCLETDRRATST